MLGEGPEKGENSHRLQPHSPVDEWLLMCGEYSWLSWPLWGKVKIVVFLRQSQFLKDYLFIMLSIYNSFRKLFQNGELYINKSWYSVLHRTQTPMCACVCVIYRNAFGHMERMVSWNQSHLVHFLLLHFPNCVLKHTYSMRCGKLENFKHWIT